MLQFKRNSVLTKRRALALFSIVGIIAVIAAGIWLVPTSFAAKPHKYFGWPAATVNPVGAAAQPRFRSLIPGASLLVEEFSYATGQLTDVNGGANVSGGNWANLNGTTNPITVTAGSLSYAGYPSSGIGNKVDLINGSAEDAFRPYTPQTVGNTTYAGFLVNVTSTTGLLANTSTTGDYFAGFLPSDSLTDLDARVSIKVGSVAGTYQLGLRATSANTTSTFSTVDLSPGTTYLVVFSYQLVAGNANDVIKMWVNPATGGAEPGPTVTQTTASATDNANVARFFLRQGTNAVNASIDGIRVGTTWADIVGVATPTNCQTATPLTGSQEVPQSGSAGTGTGTTSLSADESTLFVNLNFSGLGSNASDAHIHGPAGIGSEAGVVFGLTGVPAATSGSIPTQSFPLTPTQLQQYKQGLFYFNVHAVNFPGGEIRGQIFPACGSPVVQFGTSTFRANESETAIVTVNRTGDTSGSSSVTFSTVAGGTALGGACPGSDFANTTQTVSFAAGETTKTIDVPICSDLAAEGAETVNIALTGPSVGTSLGVQSSAVLSIDDGATQYRNADPISVTSGFAGSPYPSSINVSGGPTNIFRIRVTLFDFAPTPGNHVDVLLVGPNGAKYVLMAHGGVSSPPPGSVTLTFFDAAANVLPTNAALTSGTFLPTSCDPAENFPVPAPAGPYVEPGCDVQRSTTETLFGAFSGSNANGVWSLYIRDEENPGTAVVGTILGGWGIEFLASTAADAVVSGRVLTAEGSGLRGARVTMVDSRGTVRSTLTSSLGYYQFDDVETGASYVVGVSSKRFRFTDKFIQVLDTLTDVDFVGME